MNDESMEDVVSSAVRKERTEGKFLLDRFREKLTTFENEYDMKTVEFIDKFEAGTLGDDEDFFEWKAIYESVKYWENKIEKLEQAS